jgi:hypothetical protein
MRHSEQLDKIAAALCAAQAKIGPVVKDSTNPHFKSKFASLGAVTEAIRPPLLAVGISVLQSTTDEDDSGFCIETMLLHTSGQWLASRVRMPMDKPTAQGAGSAITYGRRYGLAAALGVVADEDDDGNAATTHNVERATDRAASRPAPSTPRAPSGGNNQATMPFGKTKGTPLAQLSDQEITGALEWARSKDKFTEFQEDAIAELARRGGGDIGEPEEPEGWS